MLSSFPFSLIGHLITLTCSIKVPLSSASLFRVISCHADLVCSGHASSHANTYRKARKVSPSILFRGVLLQWTQHLYINIPLLLIISLLITIPLLSIIITYSYSVIKMLNTTVVQRCSLYRQQIQSWCEDVINFFPSLKSHNTRRGHSRRQLTPH